LFAIDRYLFIDLLHLRPDMKLKLCTALLTVATVLTPLSLVAEKAQNPADAKRAAVEVYGKLPLSFEATGDSARFLAHSGGYSVTVGASESAVAVTDAKSGKHQTLRFSFDQANVAASLEAIEPQPGVTNYYLGQDPGKWRLGVKNYAKVRAQGVYPGVDVIYYGDHRRLEFDFVIAPKADPRVIALSFSGMDKFYKDANGDLVAEVNGQPVRFVKPYAYQKIAGVPKPVAVDYELASAGRVHLRLGDYDSNAELIIDPVVSYATYLGGSKTDVANGIAVDSQGSAYITGGTCSSNFPVSSIFHSGTFQGACDAYVTKFSPDGLTLEYTTILGGLLPGNSAAEGYAIGLDSLNQAYIVGATNIEDLPGNTGGALNVYQGGDSDAFIVILNPSGSLQRSSYLGGSGADYGYGVAVDQGTPANVTVVGQTCSQDFPGYNAFETKVEACVAFITKLDNNLDIASPISLTASALSPAPASGGGKTYYFSEFFGGQPVAPYPTALWEPLTPFSQGAIIVDTNGNVQIALNGGTSGLLVPATTTLGVPIPDWKTTISAITIEGTPPTAISWMNYGKSVGTSVTAYSEAYGVAVDSHGDAFVAGGTNTGFLASTLWPCSPGGSGAWVLKVSGMNGACRYEWTLETTPADVTAKIDTARAIAVDSKGQAYVVGTMTGALPKATSKAYNSAVTGGSDAFLLRVNNLGSAIDYATYLGGTGDDQGLGVAVDESFQPYVTGGTTSIDFPVINPLQNPNTLADLPLSGVEGAFIAKFTADGSALILSSYLGGSVADQGNAIAVAPNSDLDSTDITNVNMYVAGSTTSPDLLTTLLAQPMVAPSYVPPQTTFGGNGDAFVSMILGSSIPTVTVTPGSLSFPIQDVNTTSIAMPVFFTIQGASTVSIKSISFSNPEFGQTFVGASGGNSADCPTFGPITPTLIPPTVSGCTVWVIFTPTTQGKQAGYLTITDGTSSKPHVINLTGQGATPVDQITAANPFLFPAQVVSTSSPAKLVTLKNSGTGTLFINGITNSVNPAEFSETDTCGAQLASGSSCTISVVFTPNAVGQRTGTLTITDNAPGSPHTINLQGTGVGVSAPTITPTSLTFAGQPLNSTSSAQQVTLTNTAAASLNIGSVVISGTNLGDFNQSNNCGTVAPGGSCIVNVTFTPTVLGSRGPASLVFTDSATNSPQTVALTGSGIAAAGTISLSPATVPFGNQAVGTTSTSQTVTLTNSSSTSALSLTSITVTGPNASDFVQTNSCPPLAAGASCPIKLTFTPSVAGAESASLTVTASASNSPQSVSLTGTGVGNGTGSAPGPFTVTPEATGVSITQGGTAVYSLAVAPMNGFNNSITFTCAGPTGSSCSLSSPNPVPMDGTTVPTVKVYVNTTGGNGTTANSRFGARSIFLALLPFSLMGILLINKRRGIWLALTLVGLCLALGSVSCGSGSSSSTSSGLAAGSYQVVVTAAASGTPPSMQTVTLSLVVNKQ
jgi:hypothetical protein